MDTLGKIEKFASAMLDTAELDDLLWTIAQNIGETLGFEDCVIYLVENNKLYQKAAYGIKNPESRTVLNEIVIPVGDGIVGYVAQTGIAEIIEDTSLDLRYIWDEFSGCSELTVPIIYEGRTVAVLDSESTKLNAYTVEHKRLLQVIANIAAPRIISAQYCEQLKTSKEKVKRVNVELENNIFQLKRNQESLIQSEKMASVGLLASGVAHEINNPLGFSLSNLSVLEQFFQQITTVNQLLVQSKNLPKNIHQAIHNVEYQHVLEETELIIHETQYGLTRIKDIVENLCGYVKNKEEPFKATDVNKSISSALTILRGEISNRCNLQLNLNNLPKINANNGKLSQVFINVILNAVQATPDAGRVTINTYTANDHIVVDVTDDGCGISPENLKEVFDPFYTTKPMGLGTGLGLFLCYRIIKEEHGGDIKVFSGGKGTTFRITLPEKEKNRLTFGSSTPIKRSTEKC